MIYNVFRITAHSEQLGINPKAVTNRTDMVGKTFAHEETAAQPSITRVGWMPRAAERSEESRAKLAQHTSSRKKYKIVSKSQRPSHFRFLRNDEVNNLSGEKLISNASSTMNSKKKKSVKKAGMSVLNVLNNIEDTKTRKVRNSLRERLLKSVLRLEHKKRFSTKSSIFGKLKFKVSGVKLAELAKRYGQYTTNNSNQTNYATNNLNQTNNSSTDTKTLELQVREIENILDKLQRLEDNEKVLTRKNSKEKQIKFPSLLTGDLNIKISEEDATKMLGKLHLAKKYHKHRKFKKVNGLKKDRKGVRVPHSRSGEPTETSGSDINVAGYEQTVLPPSVMDVPSVSSADNPPPSPPRASSNQEMTLDTVNRFDPAVTGLGQLSGLNQQKLSGVNRLNTRQGFGSKMAADELVYGAAQLDQQHNLGALETEQREGIQGRLAMLTNRQSVGPNLRRYPDPLRYRSFMGQYPTFGGLGRAPYVNPGLNYEALLSMNKFRSWRSLSALTNYPRYPYPVFRRRSFYPRMRLNFSPWSYFQGRNYERLYRRFNNEGDWNKYPGGDSYETSPGNLYDDGDGDDNDGDNYVEGLRSRNSNYSEYSEDGDDEDTAEEGDRGYRRMGISGSSKSLQKTLERRLKRKHFSKSAIKKSSHTRIKSVVNRHAKGKAAHSV